MYLKIYHISAEIFCKHRKIVWLLVWQCVFLIITGLTVLVLGVNQTRHGVPLSRSLLPPVYVFLLLPYFAAAFLGTLAEAMRQNPVTIGNFFGNGLRYFGRSYGLILSVLLVLVTWLLVIGVLFAVMHIVLRFSLGSSFKILALVGLFLALIGSMWLLWTMNLLFVGGFRWLRALKYAWILQRKNFFLSLAATITALAGQLILIIMTLWITRIAGIGGQMAGLLLVMFLTMFWTLSFMALYRLTRKTQNPSQ